MIKVTHKIGIKRDGERDNQIKQFFQKHINIKKCYCCGSGTHMLNNCKIRDTITIYQWFDST